MFIGSKIRYYQSYAEDFVHSPNQDFQPTEQFQWGIQSCVLSKVLYGLAYCVGFIYCKLLLQISIQNKAILKDYRKVGYFLYANHTQPIGDVFMPALASWPKRIMAIVSPANLGLPIIGHLLPYLGSLPTTDTFQGIKKLREAVVDAIEQKRCMVIFPEGHVWPYCTWLRPFSKASFYFPVVTAAPSFCMTTTYQKRRHGKKPKITVYIDGPFFPKCGCNRKERQEQLSDEIYACMLRRSQFSNYDYIRYERRETV